MFLRLKHPIVIIIKSEISVKMSRQTTKIDDIEVEAFDAFCKSLDAGLSKVCKDKPITLLYGPTGAGKSTFALATQGEMLSTTKKGCNIIYEPSSSNHLVSANIKSATTTPTVYNNVLDLPGLSDTRGAMYQIRAAYSIYSAARAFTNIRIAIVVTESMLLETRLVEFRKVMRSFDETFKWNSGHPEGICLLVTKVKQNAKQDLKDQIQYMLNENPELKGVERQVLEGVANTRTPLLIFRSPQSLSDKWKSSEGIALNEEIDQIPCTKNCKSCIVHSDEAVVLFEKTKKQIALKLKSALPILQKLGHVEELFIESGTIPF